MIIYMIDYNIRLFNSVLYNTEIYLDEYPAVKTILDEPLGESNILSQLDTPPNVLHFIQNTVK